MIKLLTLSIILLFTSFSNLYTDAKDYIYAYVPIDENNITIESNDNIHTINIENLSKNEYYLFSLKTIDGNDIDVSYSNYPTFIESDNIFFKSYTDNIYFNDSYENYFIIKNNHTTNTITFETDEVYQFSFYIKDFNRNINYIDEETNIMNDLMLTNINSFIYNYQTDTFLSFVKGTYYNNETVYIYVYSSVDLIYDSFTFCNTDKETFDISVSYVNDERSIYKYRVDIYSIDTFNDNCTSFKIISGNSKTRVSSSFTEQVIELETKSNNIYFTLIEKLHKKAVGESHYYDVEVSSWNPFSTDADYTRYHYVLFDVYVENIKYDMFEMLEVNLTSVTVEYERTTRVDNIEMTGGKLKDSDWTKYGNQLDIYESKFDDYITGETITEKVTPSIQEWDSNNKFNSILDLFGIEREQYYFNTLCHVKDAENDEKFKNVKFNGYSYCLFYNSLLEDGETKYGFPTYESSFNYVPDTSPTIPDVRANRFIAATAVIKDKVGIDTSTPKMLEFELTYKGETKSFNFDESDITPPTDSKDPPYETGESIWQQIKDNFKKHFGFDIDILISIIVAILAFIIIGVVCANFPLFIKCVQYFLKGLLKVISLPFIIFNKKNGGNSDDR